MKNLHLYLSALLIGALITFSGCDDDEPTPEPVAEIINSVFITFTPIGGGDAVTGSALDPDGQGPEDFQVQGPVTLSASTDYVMTIDLFGLDGEDIGEEVKEESDEHMFFFEFSDALFTSPTGNGNIDNRNDNVNYQDFDANTHPLGLKTKWSTEGSASTGTLRIVLKHQPGSKSATSTVNDGESDLDVTWTINIE